MQKVMKHERVELGGNWGCLELGLPRKLWEMTVSSSMVTIVTKNNVLRMSRNKLRKRLVLGRSQGS